MKRILIVDDSAHMRQYMRAVLTAVSFEVVDAADGNKGLALLEGTEFDLVITDLNLPALDIVRLLEWMTGVNPTARHLMVCSASLDDIAPSHRNLVEAATVVIAKPFHPREFLEAVALAMG